MRLLNNSGRLESKFTRGYNFTRKNKALFQANAYIDRIERYINALERKPGNHHEHRQQLLNELHRMEVKKRNMMNDE